MEHQQEDGEEEEEREAGIASSGPDTGPRVCGILLSTTGHMRKESKCDCWYVIKRLM